ncbi:hypothetical protein T492DRAFT_889705 [Pavlovales sp. CCMP2436]|nr:hypothetical protein T492DRAFT_889705 [Pavlovales sp. CCMP2436]
MPTSATLAAIDGGVDLDDRPADVLEWVRANVCGWNWETAYFAAIDGHTAILHWAWLHGCLIWFHATVVLAGAGDIASLEWWDECTTKTAVESGNL